MGTHDESLVVLDDLNVNLEVRTKAHGQEYSAMMLPKTLPIMINLIKSSLRSPQCIL